MEADIHEMSGFRFSVFFSTVTALALASGLCFKTFLLFLPLIVFDVLILLVSIALVAALARIGTSTFCFPSEPDETSMFGKIFLLSLAALVEVGFNSSPLVVAAVVICPSSTKSMFSGEGFVLAPGFGVQLAGLKIWKEILKRSPLYT